MSLEIGEEIQSLTIIVEYIDGTRELKTSLQDEEEVLQLLDEVAEEVEEYGLDYEAPSVH